MSRRVVTRAQAGEGEGDARGSVPRLFCQAERESSHERNLEVLSSDLKRDSSSHRCSARGDNVADQHMYISLFFQKRGDMILSVARAVWSEKRSPVESALQQVGLPPWTSPLTSPSPSPSLHMSVPCRCEQQVGPCMCQRLKTSTLAGCGGTHL